VADKKLLYIGDSLGVGTAPQLRRIASPRYEIDPHCEVGMNSAWGEDKFNDFLGSRHSVVVFDMGTNDGNNPGPFIARLGRIRSKLGGRHLVVATMNGAAAGMNDELRDWCSGKKNVHLVKWRDYSQDHDVLGPDGIHPTASGYKRRAKLFSSQIPQAMLGAGASAGSTSKLLAQYTTRQNTSGNWKTRKQWKVMENVGMRPSMSLDDLVLNWTKRKVPDLDFKGAVESITIDRTIEGASTVTVTLRDPNRRILSVFAQHLRASLAPRFKKAPEQVDESWEPLNAPDLIGRAVDLELDGVTFRLTKLHYSDANTQLSLTFEDRVVYWLRRKGGRNGPPRHANRKKVTRAQFIYSLIREIKAQKVPFVCPEMMTRQRVASIPEEEFDSDSKTFKERKHLTVKGVAATPEQRRNMEKVIGTANNTDGASSRSVLAVIVAVIAESTCKNLPGGDRDSEGILQVRQSIHPGINARDIGDCVEAFCERGFWKYGGANKIAQDHPNMHIQMIAQNTQGSGTADGSNYGAWVDEAKEWLRASEGLDLDTGVVTYKKSFQFKREKSESSWESIQRLAQEVNWKAFMVGNSMYYMSEPQLYKRRVRYNVKPGDDAVMDLEYDMDWAPNRPVNEATLKVNLERWSAPPGSVIMLEGWGPPDGRWIVSEVHRDWFSPTAELTIRTPNPPKKEPAPETDQRDTTDSQGDISKLYNICKHISDATPGYVYGGGHGPPLSQLHGSQGLDCSSSTSLALQRAGLWDGRSTARVSGEFNTWGRAGRGELFTVCWSDGHVYIRFEGGAGVDAQRFDTSGWGDGVPGDGPKLRFTQGREDDQGMKLRHWPDM
jgi:hypothetical protein